MLIEFSVENYRSFQEKQTFSMVASEDKAMLDTNTFPMPNTDKLRLLKSTVIYGANASGKSNLLRAMQVLRNIVVNSASRMQKGDKFSIEPFRLNSELREQPTSFEVIFIHKDIRYEYGLALNTERVYEEWLIAHRNESSQKWFFRKYSPENPNLQDDKGYEWSFGRGLKGEKKRIQKLVRYNSLFLSHAAQNNHPQLSEIFEWFQQRISILNPNSRTTEFTLSLLEEDQKFSQKVVKLIRNADIDIFDIHIETNPISDNLKSFFKRFFQEVEQQEEEDFVEIDEIKRFDITTVRQMNDSDNYIEFEMSDESGGTQRLFELAGLWLYVLQHGELLIVDELDTSLHPLLSQALVKMFHDPDINENNAQLIFTTHDTTLLDEDIFRSDQIWFTEKDRNMSTNMYSLLEFKINEDESLQKGYQSGRYGAIPLINRLNT
ncbi:MAG: ATP-binding protein [Calothrix sp. MO_192.B10]|nr:ATP-binding protein [Calothrix sp. MO_192.B10]